MKQVRQVEIVNRLGLHARAAASFVNTAQRFDAEIRLAYRERSVNGKSIMGVMMLAAGQGSILELTAEGPDADVASEALAALIAERFGEPE